MDYSLFDSLIDSIFVVDENRRILYCNEPAAALFESSVPRLLKSKKAFHEYISFSDKKLFVMPNGDWGKDQAAPVSEVGYELAAGKKGKLQISIQPFQEGGARHWAIMIRETSLEAVLHAKHHEQLAKLEAYSKNLEKMVSERTAELNEKNRMLAAIMNSLGQGFLTFDSSGKCSHIFTRACEDILEGLPAGKNIWDILKLKEKEFEEFKMWMSASFSEALPFDSLKELAPKYFSHSQSRHVTLDYFPIRSEDEKIKDLVVVATDKTAEYEAQLALEKEKQYAKLILNLINNRSYFEKFLAAIPGTLQELFAHLQSKNFDVQHVFRTLHTLEGEAGTFGAESLRMASRHCQEAIEPVRQNKTSMTEELRSKVKIQFEELGKTHQRFLQENSPIFQSLGIGGEKRLELSRAEVDELFNCKTNFRDCLQRIIDSKSKVPLTEQMTHFDEIVESVSKKLKKKVNRISFTGENINIDPQSYEGVFAALVHAFRNAVDHGIEAPGDRVFSGKPEAGSISVHSEKFSANNQNWIRIVIADDGQGIDPKRIRTKVKARNASYNESSESDAEVIQHIFDAGLTSREEVGQFSGRGVGLDALKVEVERLGGNISVSSVLGKGTQLTLEVPELEHVSSERKTA